MTARFAGVASQAQGAQPMMGESQSGWLPACSVRRMTGESRNGGPPLTDEGQPHSQTAGVWLVLLFGSSLARGRHPVAPLPLPVLLAAW